LSHPKLSNLSSIPDYRSRIISWLMIEELRLIIF
jgi:hypothetical protein